MNTVYPNSFTDTDRKIESASVTESKITALLRAMTIDEKCSLLGGCREPEEKGKIGNAGYQWGVPRLGIPEVVMYDGPAGITGIVETTGLPQPILLGSTWSDALAYRFGQTAAEECKACSGNMLLAPQLDVIRSPHFYRNKDMKAEDSYLCGRLGAAETKGVQDSGVVATIKHFTAANLFGDDLAHFPKQYVDEQTLHETYCRSFQKAIEAGAGSVMNAYNDVNGSWVSQNRALLIDILREQWQFRGSVMSDWGSVHAFTLDKGVDMEMPFPAFNAKERIEKRLQDGAITMDTVDTAVWHVLYGLATAGFLGLVRLDGNGEVMTEPGRTQPIEMEWTYDQIRQTLLQNGETVAQEIAEKGIVLLTNEHHALPQTDWHDTVLLGLGAVCPITGEAQERSFGCLERMRSGKEALQERTGVEIPAFTGVDYLGTVIPASALYRDPTLAEHGLIRTYGIDERDKHLAETDGLQGGGAAFNGGVEYDEDGTAVDTGLSSYNAEEARTDAAHPVGSFCCVDARIDFTCGTEDGKPVKTYRNGKNGTAFSDGASFTWRGVLVPPEDGDYDLVLHAIGGQVGFLIQMDGAWHTAGESQMREWAQWPWESIVCTPEGMGVTSHRFRLAAGKAYPILVHARHCVKRKDLQLRLAWVTPSMRKRTYEAALQAAAKAKTLVFFAADSTVGQKASDKRLTENCCPM